MAKEADQTFSIDAILPALSPGLSPGYFIFGTTAVLAGMDKQDLPASAYRLDYRTISFIPDLSVAGELLTSNAAERVSFDRFAEQVRALINNQRQQQSSH
ncbi:MAG: hypothetical protein KI792_09695 [Alphaproteobacteria bacterium]|nr:hypothetical protein [Alphaproteobacteria bacterium SS10]